MNEIEKILMENMEDYESVKRQAQKFIHENRKELSKNYEYADVCGNPVKDPLFFFLVDEKRPGSELLLEMLDYALKGQSPYDAGIFYACVKGGLHLMKKAGVTYVKEGSHEYLEALSEAKYIFSNVILPGSFVKKEEQTYFNPMLEVYDMKSVENGEFLSAIARELLKTDYICAPSKSKAKEAWLEKCSLGKVYAGKVLIEKKDKAKEGRGSLLDYICQGTETQKVEAFSLRDQEKKKVLILSSWKAEREARTVVQKMLDHMDQEKYDAVIYSGWLGGKGEVKEFLAFEKEIPKVMGAGRMTLNEEDFQNYRMIEKNPALYLENPKIRRYMRGLAKREWGRLFGSSQWDAVILAGSVGYLPYYLAAEAPTKLKVLVDLDFLPYIHEKYPARWRRALMAFDRIYAPADCMQMGNYGQENRLRVMRLPVFVSEKPKAGQVETVSYNGEEYLVCEKWKQQGERISMKLVQKPAPGSILVNGDLPPTDEQKKALEQLAGDHRLYVLGTQSSAYKSFLPEAVVLDEYVRKQLYLHPAAWEFFGAFDGYVGNQGLEYDATEKICKSFGVKKCLTE